MGRGVGCKCILDLILLWLWCRLAAIAPTEPLAWEPLCAMGMALKNRKKKKVLQYSDPEIMLNRQQLQERQGSAEKQAVRFPSWCEASSPHRQQSLKILEKEKEANGNYLYEAYSSP